MVPSVGTIGVDFNRTMILTVVCTDAARGTFFDVVRDGKTARRQVLEAGETFRCRVLPGLADITFGQAVAYSFEPEGGDDDVVG